MKYLILALVLSSCASNPPCKGLTHNCINGDEEACYKLGSNILKTLGPENPDIELTKEKSAQWFKKGCEYGHQKSCLEYKGYQDYKATQLNK